MCPRQIAPIDNTLRQKVAAHIVTNYHGERTPTVRQISELIPSKVIHWSKMKLVSRDETIRAISQIDGERSARDNTFVKVSHYHHTITNIHSSSPSLVCPRS